MKIKRLIFFVLASFLYSCHSHMLVIPNEKSIKKIVLSLDRELSDSIKTLNQRSESIRLKMLKIIKEKDFDEKFIIGENRKYFNVGMSQHFIKVPKPMIVKYMDRDKKVENLENLHIALFHLDVKYLLLIQSKQFLDSIAANNEYSTIYEGNRKISRRTLKKNIAFKALKYAADKVNYSYKGGSEIPKIKFLSKCEKSLEENDLLPEYIEGSFPVDGQYNFYIDKSRKNVNYGFIKLAGDLDGELYNGVEIIFTNTKNEYHIENAIYDGWNRIISFKIPQDFLKNNKIYKMQLAVVKDPDNKRFSIDERMKRYVYNVFDILKTKDIEPPLSDFKLKHNPIYFRTSKYDNIAEKIDLKQPLLVENPFEIHIKLDEPLDSMELYGDSCMEKTVDFNSDYINFKLQITNVFSKRLAYYLSVPELEEIDTTDIDKEYTAFVDNTYKSHDIIFANGKLAEDYILDANRYFGIDFNFITPNYCQQDISVKKITEKDFLRGKSPEYKNVHLTITYPEYRKIADSYDLLVEKVLTRKKERANYYYHLHILENKRNNKKPEYDLKFFLDREERIIKSILKSNYKEFSPYDLLKPEEKIRISYKIPFTDTRRYNIPIKIKTR